MALRGFGIKAVLSPVFLVHLVSERGHLAALEIGDLDRPPSLGSSRHGGEHQLENRLFAPGIGDDLEAPALLDKQPFKQIGRPRCPAVGHR